MAKMVASFRPARPRISSTMLLRVKRLFGLVLVLLVSATHPALSDDIPGVNSRPQMRQDGYTLSALSRADTLECGVTKVVVVTTWLPLEAVPMAGEPLQGYPVQQRIAFLAGAGKKTTLASYPYTYRLPFTAHIFQVDCIRFQGSDLIALMSRAGHFCAGLCNCIDLYSASGAYIGSTVTRPPEDSFNFVPLAGKFVDAISSGRKSVTASMTIDLRLH